MTAQEHHPVGAGLRPANAAAGAPDKATSASENINKQEQPHPHHIDKVPVPRCRLKAKVFLWGKMVTHDAHEYDEQNNRADDDVDAMEARQNEEGRSVDTGFQRNAIVGIGFVILHRLDSDKAKAQQHGTGQPVTTHTTLRSE